jgi:hypothetical protein
MYSDARERPTASRLLDHPFCFNNPNYNFFDTELWNKIRPNVMRDQAAGEGHTQPSQGSKTPLANAQNGLRKAMPAAIEEEVAPPSASSGGGVSLLPLPGDAQSAADDTGSNSQRQGQVGVEA